MELGAKVYVPDDDEEVWVACEVVEMMEGGTNVKVRIDHNGSYRQVTITPGQPLPLQNTTTTSTSDGSAETSGDDDDDSSHGSIGIDDMCHLNYLHEPAILFNLKERFLNKIPYTYAGEWWW